MRAAVLHAFGAPLSVETVPDPVLGTGEVIVDIAATKVLAYAHEVFSGARPMLLDLPVVPGTGAIGRVRAVGPDATRLQPGDWVYCDPTVRARDDALAPDITLQGLSAGGPGGLKLQRHFRDGTFAEQIRVPTENAVPIGAIDVADAPSWCALGTMLVPFGGLIAADFKAGETLVVSGATGGFGAAAVAVALALGANTVVATGRSPDALVELSRRFGPRVRPVRMTGDEAADRAAILAAAPGPIDCVFDILPPAASAMQARAALMTVRPYGRLVLMGGVTGDLALPYNWLMRNCITLHGVWMYRPEAALRLAAMIRAGLIDLGHYAVTRFALDDVAAAVDHAAANAGPFNLTAIVP